MMNEDEHEIAEFDMRLATALRTDACIPANTMQDLIAHFIQELPMEAQTTGRLQDLCRALQKVTTPVERAPMLRELMRQFTELSTNDSTATLFQDLHALVLAIEPGLTHAQLLNDLQAAFCTANGLTDEQKMAFFDQGYLVHVAQLDPAFRCDALENIRYALMTLPENRGTVARLGRILDLIAKSPAGAAKDGVLFEVLHVSAGISPLNEPLTDAFFNRLCIDLEALDSPVQRAKACPYLAHLFRLLKPAELTPARFEHLLTAAHSLEQHHPEPAIAQEACRMLTEVPLAQRQGEHFYILVQLATSRLSASTLLALMPALEETYLNLPPTDRTSALWSRLLDITKQIQSTSVFRRASYSLAQAYTALPPEERQPALYDTIYDLMHARLGDANPQDLLACVHKLLRMFNRLAPEARTAARFDRLLASVSQLPQRASGMAACVGTLKMGLDALPKDVRTPEHQARVEQLVSQVLPPRTPCVRTTAFSFAPLPLIPLSTACWQPPHPRPDPENEPPSKRVAYSAHSRFV